MKLRRLMTLTVLMLMLTMVGACGDKDKGLDVAGLNLGKDLSSMLGEATKLLGGITDLDTAKAALPKLKEMNTGLDDIVSKAADLKPESKDAFVGMAQKSMPALEGAIAKVTEIPGVGDALKPTLDGMVAKIKGLF